MPADVNPPIEDLGDQNAALAAVPRGKKNFEIRELKGKFRDNPYFQKNGTVAGSLGWLFK